MTPFIDVMLVLLIIFMVAAPLATVDVNVDLPRSTAAAQPAGRAALRPPEGDLSILIGKRGGPHHAFSAGNWTRRRRATGKRIFPAPTAGVGAMED